MSPGLSLTLQGNEHLCHGAGPPPKATKPAPKAAPKVSPKLCGTSPRSPGRTQAQAHLPAQAGKQDAAEGAPAAKGGGKADKAGKAPKRAKKEEGEPVVKRERKVYDMPGQTKATPDEARARRPPAPRSATAAADACGRVNTARAAADACGRVGAQLDPLRKFYTSTLEQLPGSEMAKRWCGRRPGRCRSAQRAPCTAWPPWACAEARLRQAAAARAAAARGGRGAVRQHQGDQVRFSSPPACTCLVTARVMQSHACQSACGRDTVPPWKGAARSQTPYCGAMQSRGSAATFTGHAACAPQGHIPQRADPTLRFARSPGKSPAKQHRPAPKKEAGGAAAGTKPAAKRPAKRRAGALLLGA